MSLATKDHHLSSNSFGHQGVATIYEVCPPSKDSYCLLHTKSSLRHTKLGRSLTSLERHQALNYSCTLLNIRALTELTISLKVRTNHSRNWHTNKYHQALLWCIECSSTSSLYLEDSKTHEMTYGMGILYITPPTNSSHCKRLIKATLVGWSSMCIYSITI